MNLAIISLVLQSIFTRAILDAPTDPATEGVQSMLLTVGSQTAGDLLPRNGPLSLSGGFDPGTPPEGDYLGWATFTRDGSRILLTNRVTRNVTVFDWGSMKALANIPVGAYPAGIAVSDRYAVVACAGSNEIYVIDLTTYSIAAVIPSAEQPWIVRVSPDGRKAYVACDVPDVLEVIDLDMLSLAKTIAGFPTGIFMYSWSSENGRNAFSFTNFEVTPDGAYLVAGDYFTDSVAFFNTATGNIDYRVGGVPACVGVSLSGDGSKVVAISLESPLTVHQIDIASHTKKVSVILTGYEFGDTNDVAVNADGSKAFVSLDNNSSAIVRFPTADFRALAGTHSPFWIGVSPDHAYAISGQSYFSLVDFATESVIGQWSGISQYFGATSPVGRRVASFDPFRHEGVYFYDYTTPSSPAYRGTTLSGLDPEGDGPRRVAIAPNGTKAVITNALSGNATILNLQSHSIEATLSVGDRVQDVAITSDSRWAVICGFSTYSLKILDLLTNKIVADVPTGGRPSVVSISPDDAYAYVGILMSNTVSVVRLAGASSRVLAEIPCGALTMLWTAYGVSSDVKVSPNGRYVLVAASMDNQVKVIDSTRNAVVSSLTVGQLPMQIAFTGDGEYAIVTNTFDDTYSVIHVVGASSSVVGTFLQGRLPLRLAYNKVLDETAIVNMDSRTVDYVNPRTGALIHQESYAVYGTPIQVIFDEWGSPIVLTASDSEQPGFLVHGGVATALSAVPAHFAYSPGGRKAVVAMPGPDFIYVHDFREHDLPGMADYTGDAQDELGVFRNGMWFLTSSPDYTGVDLTRAFGSPVSGRDHPEIGEFNCLSGGGGVPDGHADLVLLRNAYATWMVSLSGDWGSAPDLVKTFGTTSHKRIPTRWLDTNGDGCSDIGVFRDGCFDVLLSPGYSAVGTHVCFGLGTDTPLAGDLDGDGKSDFILWRPASGHFTYRLSSEGYSGDHGADIGAGDYPLVGEFNGDGRTDLGSYKASSSTFRFLYSPDFVDVDLTRTHGVNGDIPIVAEVNGDGVSDIGIFRSALARWWFKCSPDWSMSCLSQSFGQSGDIPVYGRPPGMP